MYVHVLYRSSRSGHRPTSRPQERPTRPQRAHRSISISLSVIGLIHKSTCYVVINNASGQKQQQQQWALRRCVAPPDMMCTLLFWSFAIAGGIGFDSLDSLIHSIVGGGHNNQKRYANEYCKCCLRLGKLCRGYCTGDTCNGG